MSSHKRVVYPFSAIVGQDALKTALLVNAVDPWIGGVLVRGQKGTAKSTAVRALATVLPEIDVVDGCRYSCDPYDPTAWCDDCRVRSQAGELPRIRRRPAVIDLPVSATEDRLVGTLDIEHALKKGEKRFEAGLLADANRGILYVDEVNLLDDHLVDTLLDVAAMGMNNVQREGMDLSHPARFMLVGTMNPEEGEVRPQLLDRFGLCVEIEGLNDPDDRVEIIRRRTAFEDDPKTLLETWSDEERALEETIAKAQEVLSGIDVPDGILYRIASICAELSVDGHRADLTLARGATALAALGGDGSVTEKHVGAMAPLALAHRMRRMPFEQMSFDSEIVQRILTSPRPESSDTQTTRQATGPAEEDAATAERGQDRESASAEVSREAVTRLTKSFDKESRSVAGRRQKSRSTDQRGRFTRTEPSRPGVPSDIALGATVREAAVRQRERSGEMAINVRSEDVQNKVRTKKVGASIVFCVDASGSMGSSVRMKAAKAAILELLVDAYRQRDRVGLVSFHGDRADLLLSPTASVELAQLKLDTLPTGGSTPLAHGIRKALEVLETEKRRNVDAILWLVLVTDGRANVGLDGGLGSEDARTWAARARKAAVNTVVLDTDTSDSPVAGARDLAKLANGEYVRLSEVSGSELAQAVRQRLIGGVRRRER